MSPALLKKYLAAARLVADHLVLKPDGLRLRPAPGGHRHRPRQVLRPAASSTSTSGSTIDYADYFLAAWRFQHRAALGQPDATLADVAAEAGLSPKYLATVWSALTETPAEVGPLAALQAMWRELPPPDGERPDAARAGCERMRDFVVAAARASSCPRSRT